MMRLTAVVLLCLLTACSQSAAPLAPATGTAESPESVHALPATPNRLVFIGTYNANAVGQVEIYDASTLRFLGQFGHVRLPAALATDSSGNLYEADSELESVQVFNPPYARPAYALDDKGYSPDGLFVDRNGDVWVANFCTIAHFNCSGPGDVIEYPHGLRTPKTLRGGPASPVDVATDANGNVWADGLDAAGNCVVGRWHGDLGAFVKSGINCNDVDPSGNVPGGITFDDKGNLWLAYAPQNAGVLGVFAPGETTPHRSIVVSGDVMGFAFGEDQGRVFVVDFNGSRIRIFSNPQGHLIGFLGKGGYIKAYSVATY